MIWAWPSIVDPWQSFHGYGRSKQTSRPEGTPSSVSEVSKRKLGMLAQSKRNRVIGIIRPTMNCFDDVSD